MSLDFPLRGFIACDECGHPLTACWSKSKTGKLHPYYLCHSRNCGCCRKSIPSARLEREFEILLKKLQPEPNLFAIVQAMFRDAWQQRQMRGQFEKKHVLKAISELDIQIEKLVERVVEATSSTVIKTYEKKIMELEQKKLLLTEKVES